MDEMPYVSYFDMPSHLVPIRKHEALRYLGYGRGEASEEILHKLDALEQGLRRDMVCRACSI